LVVQVPNVVLKLAEPCVLKTSAVVNGDGVAPHKIIAVKVVRASVVEVVVIFPVVVVSMAHVHLQHAGGGGEQKFFGVYVG